MINIAIKSIIEAGKTIIKTTNNVINTEKIIYKYDNKIFVTKLDFKLEQVILNVLQKSFPKHNYITNVSGDFNIKSEYTWIINTIHGINNFINGFPYYCISIALKYYDNIVLSTVYYPCLDDLFTAVKGEGAQLNGKKIRVSNKKLFNKCIFSENIQFNSKNSKNFLKLIKILYNTCLEIRKTGCITLDLCHIASKRLDALWSFTYNQNDAAILILQEAGGIINSSCNKILLAGNPTLVRKLLNIFNLHIN